MSLAFTTKKGITSDDKYMTPKQAWEDIKAFIPTDKLLWEAFFGDGTSAQNLRDIGYDVVSEDCDFFQSNHGDIIVTNPPYSCKAKVFKYLQQLDKPFILILPVSTITKQYYKTYFADKCGIIIPPRRIQFVKNGIQTSRCWFDVVYICYKINRVAPREIVYL